MSAHLGDQLWLRPMRVLCVRSGHSDKGRGVAADAVELGHDRSAELDRSAGADGARIDELRRVVADKERSEISPAGGLTPFHGSITPGGAGSIMTPARTRFSSSVALFGPKPLKFYPAVGFCLGAKSIHHE
jgi:hypothetical protein